MQVSFCGSNLYIERLRSTVDKQRSDAWAVVPHNVDMWIIFVEISKFRKRHIIKKWVELAAARGHFVLMGIIWGQKMWPLYGVERCPRNRGF